MLSPFFLPSGDPKAALCSAFHVSKTRHLNDLIAWIKKDVEGSLRIISLQPRCGSKFVKALRRALKHKPRIPVCVTHVKLSRHGNRFIERRSRYTKITRKGRTWTTQPRPVVLQHIRTGKQIAAPSVHEFTRRARLGKFSRYQFNDVFTSKKLSLHGWGLPEVLNQRLELKDVFGNRYTGTIAELRRYLSAHALNRLRRGEAVGSLAPITHDYGPIAIPRVTIPTEYIVRKGNRIIRGSTLQDVAIAAKISQLSVWQVVHGLRSNVKGITLERIKSKRRRDWLARNLPKSMVDSVV